MNRRTLAYASATLAVLTVLLFSLEATGFLVKTAPGRITTTNAANEGRAPLQAVAKDAVFIVTPYQNGPVWAGGTGFLLHTPYDGTLIVTNRHVCETDQGNDQHALVQGEAYWRAREITTSSFTDLCLIRPPRDLVVGRMVFEMSTDDAHPGEHVTVYGHPKLRPLTRVDGFWLSTTNEPLNMGGGTFAPTMMMDIGHTDLSIQPGNSGSPVLNDKGEVVGVIFAMEGSGSGLAIPLKSLKRFIETRE